jgi:2-oxoglutarate dehydrogenase N-terminus
MLRKGALSRLSQVARCRPPSGVLLASRPLVSSAPANALAASPSPNDAFATGNNAYYAEEMYRRWREDPSSVHASWDAYFSGLETGLPSSEAFRPPPGLIDVPNPADGVPTLDFRGGRDIGDHLKVGLYVAIYADVMNFSLLSHCRSNFSSGRTKFVVTMSPNLTLLACSMLT